MGVTLSAAIIGDHEPANPHHVATEAAIRHAADARSAGVEIRWIDSVDISPESAVDLAYYDCLVIAPGSPYRSMEGILRSVRVARETGIPMLGTCGGCQHIIIEFARNVMGFRDAAHAEYDPYASNLFVTPLSCSIVGQTMPVRLLDGSVASKIYGREEVTEQYYCNFGLNPDHQEALDRAGLRIVGTDNAGEARVFAIEDHPFFLATLFLPQSRSTSGRPHPIIASLLQAATARQARARETAPLPVAP